VIFNFGKMFTTGFLPMLVLVEMAHSGWLDKIPFEVIGLGSLMLVIITLIHGAGLDRIVDHYRKRSQILRERKRSPRLASLIFAWAILLMLFLHIMELGIWGVVLNLGGLIPNLRDSVYFSANTYTTIGYGKMILPESWRELSPIIAISGLFTFAWTTGQMFELVGIAARLPRSSLLCMDKGRRPGWSTGTKSNQPKRRQWPWDGILRRREASKSLVFLVNNG
jgi:Ion channel